MDLFFTLFVSCGAVIIISQLVMHANAKELNACLQKTEMTSKQQK